MNINTALTLVFTTVIILGSALGLGYLMLMIGGPLFLAWVAFSTVMGAAFLPLMLYLVGEGNGIPYLGGVVGRILHTVASIGRQRTVVIQKGRTYQTLAADTVRDSAGNVVEWVFTVDGVEYRRGDLDRVIRLGKRPWAFLPIVRPEYFRRFTSATEDVSADGGGVVVRGKELVRQWGSGGGPSLSRKAEEKAFEKYGGDDSLSAKWMVIGMTVLCLSGGIIGYLLAA